MPAHAAASMARSTRATMAGAASFAAHANREGGIAIADIKLALRSIVSLHVRHRQRESRYDRAGILPPRHFRRLTLLFCQMRNLNLVRISKLFNFVDNSHPVAYLRLKPYQFLFLTDGNLSH
jgi:hypothetical protein